MKKKRLSLTIDKLFYIWNCIVSVLSCEFLLNARRPNGGGIILLRTIIVTCEIYSLYIGLENWIDPNTTMEFSFYKLRSDVRGSLAIFGTVFAAVYIAFYARFSAQWEYLANVYNQIKQAETSCSPEKTSILAGWKAGFIEDASVLHLSSKPLFASIITAWGKDQQVKDQFIQNTPGGENRWDKIYSIAENVCRKEKNKLT